MATTTSPKGSKGSAAQPQDCCWGVPFVAMCATFVLCMPQSSTGYLYVLFMDKYHINREMASWPESIIMFSQCIGGFLVMLLLTTMSVYSVALVSAVISCVGLVCAAFAPNIAWMSVTLGAVYGTGSGASIVSFTVFTVLYFDKYRATATAFKYVGLATSGVVGPVILSPLAMNYGLGGTLLLSAGIGLHALPLVMLIKSPRPVNVNWCQWKSKSSKSTDYEGGSPHGDKSDRQRVAPEASSSTYEARLSSSGEAEFLEQQQAIFTIPLKAVDSTSAGCDKTAMSASSPFSLSAIECRSRSVTSPTTGWGEKEFGLSNTFLTMRAYSAPKNITQSSFKANIRKQLTLFRDPAFYLLLLGYTLCDWSVSMHTTTTVDYGRDKGATLEDATLAITYNAIGQFLGRTVLPFASDSVDNGRCKFAVACFACAALWYGALSVVKYFTAFVAINVALGLSEGFVTCIRSVLVNDYLGVERLPAFFGILGVALLPLSFSGPTIIGYFRDRLGSYDNFYRMLAAVNLCVAALLFIILWRDSVRLKKFNLPKMNDTCAENPVCC